MNKLSVKSLILRYSTLLILGLGSLFIIYLIVAPLTVYSVLGILNLQHGASLFSSDNTKICDITTNSFPILKNISCINTTIFFKGYYASIISACVAGSAYYLLLILNLTTQMGKKQRVKSLLFILISFFILNILRIVVFANIYVNQWFDFFTIVHKATWYFGSTILVALIWFSNIYLFKIKNIPVYTEVKNLISNCLHKK
ncbi:pacearchaeosortase [Candidatus Pacearchaeota archaeon]|nr:pacearchaeosortase [Candidatus Pacearchaeota archaeon]